MVEIFDPEEKLQPARWLIKDLVPLGHLCILLAQSGVGKSFLLESIALHVAYGKPFCGFDTVAGNVLIIDQDTPKDTYKRRLKAIAKGLGDDKPSHTLYSANMEGHSLIGNSFFSMMDRYKDVKLVILDSLHSLCGGGVNPNNTAVMSNALADIKSQCLTSDMTIMVAHHITEKSDINFEQLMDSFTHVSGMGNSAIRQQTDTEYILGGQVKDGRVERMYLRPVSKRQAVTQRPLIIRILEQDDGSMKFLHDGYYEATLNDIENNIYDLFLTKDKESFGVKDVIDQTNKAYSEKDTRVALASLERKGKLHLSREAHNMFKYRLP